MKSTYAKVEELYEELDNIKTLVSENTIPASSTKELLLDSDSIAMLESLDVYKDGLKIKTSSKEILLILISLNKYLLKELKTIRLYLENL